MRFHHVHHGVVASLHLNYFSVFEVLLVFIQQIPSLYYVYVLTKIKSVCSLKELA